MKKFIMLGLVSLFAWAPLAHAEMDAVQTGAGADGSVSDSSSGAASESTPSATATPAATSPSTFDAAAASTNPADRASVSPAAADTTAMGPTAEAPTASVSEAVASDAAASEPSAISGTVVAVDKAQSRITVRDSATRADKRIDVDPNVLSATVLNVGDNVRVDLSPGEAGRTQGVRITNQ